MCSGGVCGSTTSHWSDDPIWQLMVLFQLLNHLSKPESYCDKTENMIPVDYWSLCKQEQLSLSWESCSERTWNRKSRHPCCVLCLGRQGCRSNTAAEEQQFCHLGAGGLTTNTSSCNSARSTSFFKNRTYKINLVLKSISLLNRPLTAGAESMSLFTLYLWFWD